MTDCSYASILIGGPIKLRDLDGLVGVIDADAPSDMDFEPLNIQGPADLASYLDYENYLNFRDVNAELGRFPKIEHYLQDRAIPFDRFSESCADRRSAELVLYRPGMEAPAVRFCDNEGWEVVYRREVEKLLRFKSLESVHRRARKILGPKIPRLPPLDPAIFAGGGRS